MADFFHHGSRRVNALVWATVFALAIAYAASRVSAHESPVAHVDRTMAMWVKDGRLFLRYRVQVPEMLAVMQLYEADTDRDGKVTDAEWDAFYKGMSAKLKGLLRVELAGKPAEWEAVGGVATDPQLGQTYLFSTKLPPLADKAAKIDGRMRDEFSRLYPGSYRYLNTAEVPEDAKRIEAELDAATEKLDGAHPALLLLKFAIEAK